jgi:hypothetical protein
MRDSLLFVSGQLDETMGGQPVNLASPKAPKRRTVYALVDRQNLPDYFRAFDFASPDTSSAQRFQTTVAPQALFLLNSPLMAECADGVVKHCEPDSGGQDAEVRRIYEVLFQREPDREEIALGKDYLANQPAHDAITSEPTAWEYGWGTYDDQGGGTESFRPLPIFLGAAWRPPKSEYKIGPVYLNAAGGATGRTNIAAIRRWVAPRDGVISISGQLARFYSTNGMVRGRIVSSRTGLIAEWKTADKHINANVDKIEVKQNDTIDFIVDCMGDKRPKTFIWAPVIEMAKVDSEELGLPHIWDAKENFVDPKKIQRPMSAWEKYAQVLLFSNEFFFVD